MLICTAPQSFILKLKNKNLSCLFILMGFKIIKNICVFFCFVKFQPLKVWVFDGKVHFVVTLMLIFFAVIYDGCPKTITQGIWWPRTKFNLPAAVPCPKGSVGMFTHSSVPCWLVQAWANFLKRLIFLQVQLSDTVMWSEDGWSQTFTTAPHPLLWSLTLLCVAQL